VFIRQSMGHRRREAYSGNPLKQVPCDGGRSGVSASRAVYLPKIVAKVVDLCL